MEQTDEMLIRRIVREEVRKALGERTCRIDELSMPMHAYMQDCTSHFHVLLEHMVKVCLFGKNYPQAVGTWRKEIKAYARHITDGTVKQVRDKSVLAKRYVYDGFFGADFSEYDTMMPPFIQDIAEESLLLDNPMHTFTDKTAQEISSEIKGAFNDFFAKLIEASKGHGDIGLLNKAVEDFISANC